MDLELIKTLARSTPSKIILMVIDGLGGLPLAGTGKTELETANTPNLNKLAGQGACGLSYPIAPGITPGSAPGHLAVFGYDPVRFNIGRGILEALGIDFDLQKGDVAARGNFCTVDDNGVVTDRRAGRLNTSKNAELCRLLEGIKLSGVQVLVRPVMEHRFVLVFRGPGLVAEVSDSDPQAEGKPARPMVAGSSSSQKMARAATQFADRAKELLAEQHPANMVLLRGFSQHPDLPTMDKIFKLRAGAIATYPMYRGLAKLVGMTVLKTGTTLQDELATLKENYGKFDFFFVHVKKADSAGEDGDFARKVKVIEEVDTAIPELLKMGPDVFVVTGDHSTPAVLKSHSWHPVPLLLHSRWCRPNESTKFGERACSGGELGRIAATDIMPLAMAHAMKLDRFGA